MNVNTGFGYTHVSHNIFQSIIYFQGAYGFSYIYHSSNCIDYLSFSSIVSKEMVSEVLYSCTLVINSGY